MNMLNDDELKENFENKAEQDINNATEHVSEAAVAVEEAAKDVKEEIKTPEFSRPFNVQETKQEVVKEEEKVSDEINTEVNSVKEEIKEPVMDKTTTYTPPGMERLSANNTDNNPKDIPTDKRAEKNASKKEAKKSKKKGKKGLITFIVFLLLLFGISSVAFGMYASFTNKIVSGVSINGIDVSNLTKEEATSKVREQLSSDSTKSIKLKNGEYEREFFISEIDFRFDVEGTADAAYGVGRYGSNIFANNFDVLKTLIKKKNIDAVASYSEQKYDEFVDELNLNIPEGILAGGYKIEGDELIVEKNCSGYSVESEQLMELIKDAVLNNKSEIDIPTKKVEITNVDIEKVYKSIKKDPVDATFTKDPYEIHREEEGLDFAISLDEAKKIAAESEGQYRIPLKRITPEVTVKNLPAEAFPDELGTFYTSYATSGANRSNNVELATRTIDGMVLMPGEEFSYNYALGQRTPSRGYKEAGVYVNGKVSTDYGGGICQVSSTLYNAVLLADLEVLDRTSHYFYPGYVPAGQDATVSWGAPDFKFKNNRDYPIRISGSAGSGDLTISIYGLRKPDEYEVKVESYTTGYISPSTEYEDDPSLPEGTTKVVEGGSSGRRSETYKIYYKDGEEVSKVLVSSDSYHPHNTVVRRGTATPEPDPEPVSDPVTDPTTDTSDDDSATVVID